MKIDEKISRKQYKSIEKTLIRIPNEILLPISFNGVTNSNSKRTDMGMCGPFISALLLTKSYSKIVE